MKIKRKKKKDLSHKHIFEVCVIKLNFYIRHLTLKYQFVSCMHKLDKNTYFRKKAYTGCVKNDNLTGSNNGTIHCSDDGRKPGS